jgi:hypothetical protein
MKEDTSMNPANTAERVQQNVRNLPIASMALAGLIGAGAMALLASLKMSNRNM